MMVGMVRRRIVARPSCTSAHNASCSEVRVYACYDRDADDREIDAAVSRAYMRASRRVFPGTTTLRVPECLVRRREAFRRVSHGWVGTHHMETTFYLGDVDFELDDRITSDRRRAIQRAMVGCSA